MSGPDSPVATGVLKGRWQLGARLGIGGQGHTYLCKDKQSGKEVVAKQLKLAGAGWKRFDLFEREVRVLGQLDHAGIPRLRDHFEEPPGTFWVIMDRAPGATLRAIATRARFTEDELVDVLRKILVILAYLHTRVPAVIHRDIKPANLLRAADGTVSLVDFGGVAGALREDGGSTVVGTFGYMAPEQLHGASTPATDLYGLGATIVALAGGIEPEKVPRRGLKMDLDKHLPSLSKGLRDLLGRMTDPDPDRRPASAAETLRLVGELRRPTTEPMPVASPSTELTPLLAPAPVASARDDDDDIFDLHDRTIPAPLRALMRMAFFVLGVMGGAALFLGEVALVPFVFALVKAFAAREGRPKLRAAEQRVRGALREGRDGFGRLRRQALRGTSKRAPGLPAGPPPPRKLPPRRR